MLARIAAVSLVTTTLTVGCMSGPKGLASKVALQNATSSPAHAAHAIPATPTAAATTPLGPPPQVTQQQAMQQIAPMLGKLAAADPALHTETLSQLSDVEPSLWSLTVQRAVNTLEYRQQLAGKPAIAAATTPDAAPPTAQPSAPVPPVADDPGVVQTSATLELSTTPAMPTIADGGNSPQAISNPHFQLKQAKAPTTATSDKPTATTVRVASLVPPSAAEEPIEEEKDETTWREHLAAAIAKLDSDAGVKPASSETAYQRVRLQLMQLVAGEDDAASKATPGLSTDEQGYWSNQIYALATLLSGEGSGDRRQRADAAARHLMEASAKLRSLGSLQVRNFVTCREVYGYGAYEPLAEARYAPGDQVILYAEVDNYQSDTTEQGYHTIISSSYRLVSLDRNEVVGGEFPLVDDLCLTRRRDFHIQYGVTLPGGLSPGKYRLELSVEDKLGNKKGHDQLPLTITAR